MLALSIRQPYAELILRGEKTIEYRSRPTKLVGQRFYIYAARKWAGVQVGRSEVSGQRSETANPTLKLSSGLCPLTFALPTGVIVGSAVIARCQKAEVRDQKLISDLCSLTSLLYEWHLTKVKRYKRPRKVAPGRQPQPVWFRPF